MEIAEAFGVPHLSVWRSCDTLRQLGWINLQRNKKYFYATSTLEDILASAHFAPPELKEFGGLLDRLADDRQVKFDFGTFTTVGCFEIVESDHQPLQSYKPQSLVLDDIAITAQLALDRTELLRHLKVFSKMADAQEQTRLQSLEHVRALRGLARTGYLYSTEHLAISFPLRSKRGLVAGLTVYSQSQNAAAAEEGLLKIYDSCHMYRPVPDQDPPA